MTPGRWSKLSDEELVMHLSKGEMGPLGELYLRHGGMVKAAVGCFTRDLPASELEDLVQEVFLTCGETASKLRDPTKLRSWLYGIAARKARSRRRTTWLRRRKLKQFGEDPAMIQQGPKDSPERSWELRQQVAEVLAHLPASQQEVLVLHLLEGLSKAQVAETLGLSPVTVRTRLYRARQTVVKTMGELADPEEKGD